jgi:integrase
MAQDKKHQKTLEDVRQRVDSAETPDLRQRKSRSATERICAMASVLPTQVPAEAPAVRALLSKVRPAAHGMMSKTWANLLSRLRRELRMTGVIDPNHQGCPARHPAWASLVEALAGDKKLATGLAAFCNWCAAQGVVPDAVDDDVVQHFLDWLEHRTLCPKPRDVVRRTPQLWNAAREQIGAWPKTELTLISFKAPAKRLQWADLPSSLLADAEAYLTMRAKPDPFDERPSAPLRPLAASTVQQQKAHIRLAASVLVESGLPVKNVTSLKVLVEPEAFKTVLRHYHDKANGQPNAFAVGLSKTLIQVAYHYVEVSPEHLAQLKRIAAKLPPIPFELTPKNKAFLRHFESDRLRAELLFLPERLAAEVTRGLAEGRVDFVKAQMAVAIDIQLVSGLRPQNLSRLNWGRHFIEPDGSKGNLLLHIPETETKSGNEFLAEIPDHVARRLRWYRKHILPRLKAYPNGDLFVTRSGEPKGQDTLTDQIIKTIEDYLGIDMSPHQFRHLLGSSYLEDNPEDMETARALLGHAWTKTTRIYVGSSSRRASRAYNRFVFAQREALRLKRKRQRKPTKTKKDNNKDNKENTSCKS